MAETRESTFQQLSPDSSKGGDDSYKHEGTPDTRLTAFSPDENSARSSKVVSLNSGATDPQAARFTPKHGGAFRGPAGLHLEKDPFVTPTAGPKPEQKLSATASAFQPFPRPGSHDNRSTGEGGHYGGDAHDLDNHRPIGFLSPAASTELCLSRCVVLSSPSQVVTVADVKLYLSKLEQLGSPCSGETQIHAKGLQGYVRCSNLRDSCKIHRNAQLGGTDWAADFIPPPEFVQITTPGSRLATPYEGQLKLLAIVQPSLGIDSARIETAVHQILQAEGDLFAFVTESTLQGGALRGLVEYADTNAALEAMSKYRNGLNIDGLHIILSFRRDDGYAVPADPFDGITTPTATPLRAPAHDVVAAATALQSVSLTAKTPSPASAIIPMMHHTPPSTGLHVQPQFTLYPMMYGNHFTPATPLIFDPITHRGHSAQPTGSPFHAAALFPHSASAVPVLSVTNEFGAPRPLHGYNRSDARRQNAMRIARTPFFNAASHHNHVDVNRIREGIDVRTTIMLRNIPNKVDQVMLKTIVDESSWGKYDFMYLRIDFANDCNVGYAFINFVDPLDIIDFVNARGNQRWNCFKSDKVAEISYATIQGKDCLVQKFRNSSVMLEAPHYRPKLYFTSNGPLPELAGQEEPFPEPDNQSKMKRSCENAEHVGLFTPNAGQHFRDEQRRRRSQYDRGTRLAALEEYDYETSIQHMYVP